MINYNRAQKKLYQETLLRAIFKFLNQCFYEKIYFFINILFIYFLFVSGFNKSGFDFLKKMKPMLSDLNTYLTKVLKFICISFFFYYPFFSCLMCLSILNEDTQHCLCFYIKSLIIIDLVIAILSFCFKLQNMLSSGVPSL